MVVGDPFEGVEAVLSGDACQRAARAATVIHPKTAVRSRPPIAPVSPMSNEMLLIVEDEVAMAELLEMALDGGYRIMTAANGRRGLQRLAQEPRPPDLVISDFDDASA